MIELVLTVCTVVQGADCRNEPISIQGSVGMVECLMASQIEAARWIEHNPTFYVRRITCRPAKTLAKS
jgi:hypothetical protein